MTDNVVDFPGGTTVDIPAEKVLKAAIEADLDDVVVMGWTKDRNEYFAGTTSDLRIVQFLANRIIHQTNLMADAGLEEIRNGKS